MTKDKSAGPNIVIAIFAGYLFYGIIHAAEVYGFMHFIIQL